MKISIIIPIYNSEKYLNKCLSSVINQTYKNIEIILVDDGSTDNSLKICSEFQKKDNRIKIIKENHSGPSNARNAGIKEANGDYITFLDSDDWIEKRMVEKINNIYNNNDVELVIYERCRENRRIKGKQWEEGKNKLDAILPKLIQTEKINAVWNKMYKKEIIDKYDIKFDINLDIAEDLLFNVNYFTNISNIYVSNEELYHYRVENESSLTHKFIENKYEKLMFVNKKMKVWINTFNSKELQNMCKYIKFKAIVSCIKSVHNPKCKYTEKQKNIYLKEIKGNNKFIIVQHIEVKVLILSLIYSFMPIKLFYLICRFI